MKNSVMHFQAFLTALQFLTVFPVRLKSYPNETVVGLSLIYYPLVGAIIGGVLFTVSYFFQGMTSPVLAAFLLIVWVVCSGALHLDGFADSVDAFMAGHSLHSEGSPEEQKNLKKERILSIMKDPTSGPVAVVALVLLLLLKFALLHSLIEYGLWYVLVLSPLIGRAFLPVVLLTTPYVRENGSGSWLVDHAPKDIVWPGLAVLTIGLIALFGAWLFVTLICCLFVFLGVRMYLMARIGGTTGDTAGGILEVIELMFMLFGVMLIQAM